MIYILEDDASIRKLVVYTIQSQGMEARASRRPSQFWEALEQKTPELVLLDIMLPEEDGLQVLKHAALDCGRAYHHAHRQKHRIRQSAGPG